MAALIDAPPSAPDAGAAPGLALDALRAQLQRVAAAFTTPEGRGAAALAAASTGETELSKAFRHQVILKCRTEGKALLAEAIAQGEVRWDIDLETALDVIYGPVFFRLLIGHAAPDAAFAARLIDTVLAGLRTR
ncbi:MAG: TetR/AcrR family transcriptional regulator C-terminal ligand-binding domain-containing protein [Maricaulaceae bacterium]|nr:TetR/AcrR family transcriptional regulator C-terminal ligand-binding domain-containing protein [Maricaulaceae bacterium]